MATLPMELIAEIISRLPVKPLLRFKSVSKSWYALIKNPNFIKLHLKQTLESNTDRHLIIAYSSLSSTSLDDSSHFRFSELNDHPLESPGVEILGSCNGVLCICDPLKENFALYNPSTRSYRKLPSSHIHYPNDLLVFGFGYDSVSDDYKVFRLTQWCGCHENKVYNETKLYSLRSNSWKWVKDIPYYVLYKDVHGVLVNEALHYIVTKEELDISHKFIACFDLRSETYSLVDHPDYENMLNTSYTIFLSGLGGCLCMLVNYHNPFGCADLWVMKEYGKKESWGRLFSLRQSPTIRSFYQIKPVAYSKDGRKVLLEQDSEKLRWYDLKTKKAKTVKMLGSPKDDFDTTCVVGSLVSLDEEKQLPEGGVMRKKTKKKSDVDNFLSVGFKLKL